MPERKVAEKDEDKKNKEGKAIKNHYIKKQPSGSGADSIALGKKQKPCYEGAPLIF